MKMPSPECADILFCLLDCTGLKIGCSNKKDKGKCRFMLLQKSSQKYILFRIL